jgi:hypothetical protein
MECDGVSPCRVATCVGGAVVRCTVLFPNGLFAGNAVGVLAGRVPASGPVAVPSGVLGVGAVTGGALALDARGCGRLAPGMRCTAVGASGSGAWLGGNSA